MRLVWTCPNTHTHSEDTPWDTLKVGHKYHSNGKAHIRPVGKGVVPVTHPQAHTHLDIKSPGRENVRSGWCGWREDGVMMMTYSTLYIVHLCRKNLTKYNCFVNWIRVRGNPPSKIVSKANIRGVKGEEHIISHTVSDTWAIWRVSWPSTEPWLSHTRMHTHTFYACTQTAGWAALGAWVCQLLASVLGWCV